MGESGYYPPGAEYNPIHFNNYPAIVRFNKDNSYVLAG